MREPSNARAIPQSAATLTAMEIRKAATGKRIRKGLIFCEIAGGVLAGPGQGNRARSSRSTDARNVCLAHTVLFEERYLLPVSAALTASINFRNRPKFFRFGVKMRRGSFSISGSLSSCGSALPWVT